MQLLKSNPIKFVVIPIVISALVLLTIGLWRFQQDIKDIHRHIGITPHEIRYQLQQSNLQVALIDQEINFTKQYQVQNDKQDVINRAEQLKYRIENIRVVWGTLKSDLDKTDLQEELNTFESHLDALIQLLRIGDLSSSEHLDKIFAELLQVKIFSAAMYTHGSAFIREHTDRYVQKLSKISMAINTLILIFILLLAVLSYALTLIFKQKNDLNKLSIEDPLTGLYNRRQFNLHLTHDVREYKAQQSPLSLMIFDIDYFKLFNDHLGHIAGDHALQLISEHLKALKKANSNIEFYRVGGEEFACLCHEQDYNKTLAIAEKIRASIEALNIEHAMSKVADNLTISIGIAFAESLEELNSDSIYSAADQALYEAKKRGRNQAYGCPKES
ncbi:GGDEF domain-containing protein [Marinomonas aquiplantarum]|uniref:diguanylate cyclase n=1 Tax=Marinomonas aquiplantarum TaxID=491951 RepID=A0A366CZV0_9GAMM|nr:GGDEF domain-containing protein [Marinomonas aquiplantarum]RBO83321.1 diguanylate cyclase (GGDEF)-like protein [Marinomonas aquiplantarum]